MSESGSLSPIRRSPSTPVNVSAPVPATLLGSETVKSTPVQTLTLPAVYAAISSGKAVVKPSFTSYALYVDGTGLRLISYLTQEEIHLPLATMFDIFPVPQCEDTDELFLTAPTANLLQVLGTCRRPAVNSQQPAILELTVTLALPTLLDCTQLTNRLAEARHHADISLPELQPPPALSVLRSSPPSPVRVPEERQNGSPSRSPERDRQQSDFIALYVQAKAWAKEPGPLSPANHFDGNGYRPCDLRLQQAGLIIEQVAATQASGQGREGPWSIPWAALIEVRSADPAVFDDQPPSTHPQVLRLSVAHRAGLTRSTCCIVSVAVDSPVRTQSLLRALKGYQLQHLPGRPTTSLPSILTEGTVATPKTASAASATTTAVTPGVHPNCREMNTAPNTRASIQTMPVGSSPGIMKESDLLHVVHINNVPVSLTPPMASLLMSYQPEDSLVPSPFELSQVFILLPTVSIFQRCSILVDKLGLHIVPLVAADSERLSQERGRAAARPVHDAGGQISDYHLLTEGMIFPISALVDCAEEPEVITPAPLLNPSLISSANTSSSQAAGARGTTNTSTNGATQGAPPSTSSNTGSSGGRRQLLPFSRSLAPWEKPSLVAAAVAASGGSQVAEKQKEKHVVPEPPYPHLVGVRVKGALAGKHHGAEKTPVHVRMNTQPQPPVAITMSFAAKEKAIEFVSTMQAFKKYNLSLALSNYLNTVLVLSQRQSERRNQRCAEEGLMGVVAQRIAQCQASSPSVEPPPMPQRPADLPQANRLPRMVTNDEGEVFWYIPRKQNQPLRPQKPSGGPAQQIPKPTAQPDPDATPPPLEPNSVSLRTPRRLPSSQPSPSATSSANVSTPAGPSPGNASSIAAPPATTPPSTTAALFDDDLGDADTPAPCLASPTPTPGRKI